MGRYDADFGTLLINKGKGSFTCENLNGLSVKGQVRHLKVVKTGKEQTVIIARNSDSIMIVKFAPPKK